MKIAKLSLSMLAGAALLSGVNTAKATPMPPTYSYTFDQSLYTVGLGGTVNVNVYLTETGPGSPYVLAPAGDGLTGAGVLVSYAAPGVASVTGITGNAAFDNGGAGIALSPPAPGAFGFTESTVFSPNVTGTLIAPNTYDVLLGTYTFTAGLTSGTEQINAGIFNAALSEVITGSGAVLDPSISSGTATIKVGTGVTSVPEPATFFSGGAMAVAGAIFAWRRARRRPSLAPTA